MKKKGFTLVELLVVIAIIGLLSSIVLVSLTGARKRARDANRQSVIRQINTAMEMCYDDAGCGGGSEKYKVFPVGSSLNGTSVGPYMTIPRDPIYNYLAATSNEQKYCIYIQLESGGCACASNKGVAVTSTTANCSSTCCGMNP